MLPPGLSRLPHTDWRGVADPLFELAHHWSAQVFRLDRSNASLTSSSSADSAAGATAFSCGVKTYNGAIGVTPSLQPCGTILEAAKRQGYVTGLVATSRITHATPASFYAHVPDRDLESEIAEFLVGEDGSALQGLRVDFAFGGGKCFFLPNGTEGSCRTDEKDMLATAKAKGVRVVDGMAALRAYKDEDSVDGPVLGLFASDVRPFRKSLLS